MYGKIYDFMPWRQVTSRKENFSILLKTELNSKSWSPISATDMVLKEEDYGSFILHIH